MKTSYEVMNEDTGLMEHLTGEEMMALTAFKQATEGNPKFYELVLQMIGQHPDNAKGAGATAPTKVVINMPNLGDIDGN